jgi:hypothetical protein
MKVQELDEKNRKTLKKRNMKRYHLPVIAHFKNRSLSFSSILLAEAATGINYNLIFEACIGKLYKAGNVYWEFKKGNHYIKYRALYAREQMKLAEKGQLIDEA